MTGEGVVPSGTLGRLFYGDFATEFLSTILPGSRDRKETRIVCGVLLADLRDGVVEANPGLVLQAGSVNLFATGKIDLGTEKIDLSFNSKPRKGLGISASSVVSPYFKIGGTLSSPRLSLDTTGAAVAGGAAAATGGLSIVFKGLFDRVFAAKDPCAQALEARQVTP